MKKTLITLLALGGFTSAQEPLPLDTSDLVDGISDQLVAYNYSVGDSFDISFTLDTLGYTKNSANIIKLGLGTNDYIRIQSVDGTTSAYLGIRDNDESWYTSKATWDVTTKTNTITFDTFTPLWLTMGPEHKQQANNLTNAVLTLSYDNASKVSTVKVKDNAGITNIVHYNNLVWDATKLASGYDSTTWKDLSVSVTAAPVPEPTTATLSLLALAGLAARRRR